MIWPSIQADVFQRCNLIVYAVFHKYENYMRSKISNGYGKIREIQANS